MPEIESTTRTKRRAFGVDSRFLESTAITVSGAALAFIVAPNDPVVLRSGFPFIAFVPMLVGLLHGFAAALGSVLALGAWIFVLEHVGASVVAATFDARLALGIVLVGLVPAEFRDRLTRESESLKSRLANANERLEALSRAHSLLLASHRDLERTASAGERSLVADFDRLREELRRHTGPMSVVMKGAQDILSLFAAHGLVQSAAVLRYDRGRIARPAVAAIGGATVDPDHPLIDAAIAGRCVATVREVDPLASGVADTSVLAVVPLVDAHHRVWGVVAILEMPFIALRDDHLRVLLSIGSSLADVFSEASEPPTLHADVVRELPSPAPTIALGRGRRRERQGARHGTAR